jgi:type I restriction enzyme S subunit
MTREWAKVSIEDIAEKIAMGPFGSNIKVETFVETGVPVISGAHLRGVRLEDRDFKFVTSDHAQKMKNSNVIRGDVIFTHAGNIGQVAYIPHNSKYEKYTISQRQFYLRCDSNKAIPEFITYFFHSNEGQHKLLANASQTGVPSISQPSSYLKKIELSLPPLAEQRAIAHILGTLDDKIELNRKQNETLEAMARTLFKAWFVDFEPVRAKLEGRWRRGQSLPGLPAHLYDLFPDRLVESELGEIPEGWEVKTIGDFVTIKRGGSPRPIQDFIRSSGIPWVKISDATSSTSRFLFQTKDFIKQEGLKKTVFLQNGELILSNSATPGLPIFLELDACIHDGWLYFPQKHTLNDLYLYQLFLEIRDELVAQGNGSVFTNLKTDILRYQKIVVASEALFRGFDSLAKPLFNKLLALNRESRSLAQLRDTLLPKLISGELRVRDAEQFVARTAA